MSLLPQKATPTILALYSFNCSCPTELVLLLIQYLKTGSQLFDSCICSGDYELLLLSKLDHTLRAETMFNFTNQSQKENHRPHPRHAKQTLCWRKVNGKVLKNTPG